MIEAPLRLSPLHEAIEGLGPTWREIGGMPVPLRFREAAAERSTAERLALCDCSALARVTVKGPGAAEVLRDMQVPAALFGVAPLSNGGLIARTGSSEFFLEDGPGGNVVAAVKAQCDRAPAGVYEVLRQDASLLLSGTKAVDVLRQTCGYDFRSSPRQLIMTRIAGVSCTVFARELNGIPAFQIWLDGTYGGYLWETVLEIVREAGGDAVGLAVFFPELTGSA